MMPVAAISRRLYRYGLVGGVAAIMDIGGFALLSGTGVGVSVAATASFIAANVANYLLCARYAFGHRATVRRYPAFFAASAVGLCINVAVTIAAASALGLTPVLAKVVGVGVAFGGNFALNAFVVFPAKDAS